MCVCVYFTLGLIIISRPCIPPLQHLRCFQGSVLGPVLFVMYTTPSVYILISYTTFMQTTLNSSSFTHPTSTGIQAFLTYLQSSLDHQEFISDGLCVCLSVNLPLHHKVQKFSFGTGSPGWSRKRAVKRCVGGVIPYGRLCWLSVGMSVYVNVAYCIVSYRIVTTRFIELS